ncbi:LysR family transcriptional regulator [Achromobacter sp. ACM03]|uniref:LysR family transcriptional regulator n=1 Tax=Achromobacter sp. ACM03 TaxID=2769300 RepID=UPI00177D2EDA|nr:LysR family transcriptional regulator [Achromobacter sp. ACM03]MBD9430563.1 LysR family transcriptional regulator [Achromobacter sp. ACM03]
MLDPVLLRSFLTVVDTGNFTRASEHLHLTQSTVSQHVIRLEENLGCRLLDRTQRHVLPTEEGERLLGYARSILRLAEEARENVAAAQASAVVRVGAPEDFMGATLMPTLAAVEAAYPRLRVEVEGGLSHQLLRRYRDGELDLLLVKQWEVDADCDAHWPEPLCWITARDAPPPAPDTAVPLVAFPSGALYRQEMTAMLETCGKPWHVRFSSPSLPSLGAAVAAGLGISLLPAACASAEHRLLTPEEGFPAPRGLHLSLYARSRLSDAGHALRRALQDFCTQRAAQVTPPA